jgi:hypothetical protein
MTKKRFKTKITATDKSSITDQSIGEIIDAKINYVIKNVRENPPHISWLSKYQLIWGGNEILRKLEFNDPLRIGFVSSYDYKERRYKQSHLPGRMPTDSEQERLERLYGVALPWPPRGFNTLIQTVFRNIEDQLIKMGDQEILIAPCKGYIDTKTGLLVDASWNKTEGWNGNMISGYLIYRIDPLGIQTVNDFLLHNASEIMQRQVIRTKQTARGIRDTRISAANSAVIKGDRRLQRMNSLDLLLTEVIDDWEKLLALDSYSEDDNNDE